MDAGVTPPEPITVTVRLFAMLRERAGTNELELRLEPGATVEDALGRLAEERALGELLARLPIRTAVNREYADTETVLSTGDELALIPPVSGGAAKPQAQRTHVAISVEKLSLERVRALVSDPRAGAVVIFEGVTREIEALDYEAYAEMARERIEQILGGCIAKHRLWAAAAEHRTGRVELGEPSVIVAVSAAHREEAFAGAREAIDAIKAQAPIWKREDGRGGTGAWVAGVAPRLEAEYERDEAAEAGLERHGA
ncbi:MAG: MoaE-MoaD fusion protein [Solirubrobacteraceae bacterium]|jgi:molybdopterin synthase catalytic subunit|nr:molybdopterin converting factor, subunit 1 [Solirubrobacterales bacterium]MEA2215823.1 MoaE-MoaD fusion protein [Solirubrobacteraceae bacterium]